MKVKSTLNQFLGLTKRHLLLFFRDKTSIFFSLLAQIIILFLYLAFLKQSYIDGIKSDLGDLTNFITNSDINNFINSWLLSGLVGASTITVALNCLSLMPVDKEKKIDYDLLASPVKPAIIYLSYYVAALLSTFLISAVILSLGLIILTSIGNLYMSVGTIFITYLIVFVSVASSTSLLMIVIVFFKKMVSLQAFSGLMSAAVGFFIGAYMPISTFSKPVQNICNILPGSHITGLLRNYLMRGTLDKMTETISNYDNGAFKEAMEETFSFKLTCFGHDFGISSMIIYVLIILVFTLVLNILIYNLTKKRR